MKPARKSYFPTPIGPRPAPRANWRFVGNVLGLAATVLLSIILIDDFARETTTHDQRVYAGLAIWFVAGCFGVFSAKTARRGK
jgi:ABC-type uncharacterized transport system permease subunit